MKKLLGLLMAGCFFTACKKDNLTSTENTAELQLGAPSANHEIRRPFKGAYTTTAQVLQTPPMLKQKITGEGQATHLGESSFVAIATIVIQPPPPFAVSGTATFTAANGDEFYTKFTGASIPGAAGTSTATLHHIVTGGTGRFEHARGEFIGVSVVNPAAAANSVTYDGWISY